MKDSRVSPKAREDFIRLLYESVLRRPPSPEDVSHHSNMLNERPDFHDALGMLSAFANSPESRHLRVVSADTRTQQYNCTPIDTVLSIGSHCATSYLLKKWGLKRFSGPFDWIFSSLRLVSFCIEDEFSTLLDRSYYCEIPWDLRSDPGIGLCDHAFFRDNFSISHMFNHYNPLSEEGYGYLERCVARFKTVLNSDTRNLAFALCSAEREDIDSVTALCNAIDLRSSLEVVAVFVKEGTGSPSKHSLQPVKNIGRHAIYEMSPISNLGPVGFHDPLDEYILRRMLESL